MSYQYPALTMGRGEVYFDPFEPGTRVGTGERYVGNTTTLRVDRTIARVARATSYGGQKVALEGEFVSETQTISLVTDWVLSETLADFFSGVSTVQNLASPSGYTTETFVIVRGRYYQLGKSVQPFGLNNLKYLHVYKSGVEIDATNFSLDAVNGRLQILSTATALADGDLITVQFEFTNQVVEQFNTQPREVFGALRFVAFNQVGDQRSLYFPFVRLVANGQIDFKGDQWQQIPFSAVAMRLNAATEIMYMNTPVSSTGYTADEQALLNEGIGFTAFPVSEDVLDTVVNVNMLDDFNDDYLGIEADGLLTDFPLLESNFNDFIVTDLSSL